MSKPKFDAGHSFSDYYKRAMNPLVILALLQERPKYAYEMTSELRRRSNGLYTMPLLYPVLYRLEEQGFVEISETTISDKNRTRNYYRITEAGQAYLEDKKQEYLRMAQVVAEFLNLEGGSQA